MEKVELLSREAEFSGASLWLEAAAKARARWGIWVGGRAGARSLASLFRTELFPPLLGLWGLRLRIVWFGINPMILPGPRQGRTRTQLTQRATETALSARGAPARMS